MKRILYISIMVFTLAGVSIAQSQLENPGFEEWEDILINITDTTREPVDWSSLKTSDNEQLSNFAPVVCKRSPDAHSGKYAIELTNINSLVVANGAATNGRIHPDLDLDKAYMFTDTQDSRWNTPFTEKPDSVAGWFRYAPQGDDALQIKVILHKGFGKQPDADSATSWIGDAEFYSVLNTGNQWHRFSAPFNYNSDEIPEYVLVVLNSGNRFDPVAGSIVYFDDIEMIYNSPQSSVKNPAAAAGFVYIVNNQYLVMKGFSQLSFNTAKILDITGRQVWNGNVSGDRIDISSVNLKKGLYLVTLRGKSEIYAQKILVH
jgi:hypothetical protein